jgi:hypothetical protein
MAKEIVLIAGLPGCGKTARLCLMCRDGWLVFDDFKSNAFGGEKAFRNSRKFRALLSALRDDLRCVVADVDFCHSDSRSEADDVLSAEVPGLVPKWEFFANDPVSCEANIRTRNRSSLQDDLDCLARYSKSYPIPEGSLVLPVWQKL